MPKQYAIFGRPIRIRRFGSRRVTTLLVGVCIFAIVAISTLPSAIPATPSLSNTYHERKPTVKNIGDSLSKSVLNPFRQPTHPPPRQQNDTYAGSSWWADWKWLSTPFSSSATLDEERVMLPPLPERPPIYCYYDATVKKSRDEKDAESELLLTWRRAWWAQGFRPIILGPSEAMKSPLYEEFLRFEIHQELQPEIMRWLAWDAMGAGLLAHYTLLPMGNADDPLLMFLRRGGYPQLTRWRDLDKGLFASMPTELAKALRSIMSPPTMKLSRDLVVAITDDFFKVDTSSKSLAYYSKSTIEKKYGKVAESIENGRAKGLGLLNRLINAHLQIAWQNSFPDGIEVLKPFPDHTTVMVSNTLKLAHSLASCPDSPIPSSCPPQLKKCTPCVADSTSMKISTPSQYRNSTRAYALGTVPHPWTLASVANLRETLDIAWIRRESPRDPWLSAITKDLLGSKVSGDARVMRFKQAVADEHAASHALWLSAEAEVPRELEWRFGFSFPKAPVAETHKDDDDRTTKRKQPKARDDDSTTEKTINPPPKDESTSRKDDASEEPPKELSPEEALALEPVLLDRARRIVALTKPTRETRLRASLEAWNLADTEAWRFVRAFLARRQMERAQWEADEAKYAGGAGSEKGRSAWSRWGDVKEG